VTSSAGRRLRVLAVIDSLARAGAEQSLVAAAPHLLADGVDLHVAYLAERDGLRAALEGTGTAVHPPGTAAVQDRRARYRLVSQLVADVRPDVVHTTLFESDLVGRAAAARHGVPCVSSLVNLAYGRTETAGLPPGRARAAHLADVATGLLVTRWHAITHHVADVMGRRLLVPRGRIEVIHRGRDAALLGRRSPQRRAEVRARLGLPDDVPVLLAVGRQERQKGHDVLMRAAAEVRRRHPDLVVLLAGREGGETARLRALREDLGLLETVRLLGSRDDVPELLAAADVMAFTSRWEGAGGAVLEAMALECPLVTSALPAVREAVDAGTAALVPPDDAPRLADAVDATLRDREAARARAARARRRFEERFTIEASAARTADLYRRAAAAGRGFPTGRSALTPQQLVDDRWTV
jgi:glycosyltransferase involved in cell wall biosynthesis